MAKVFVSYARDDSRKVKRITQKLIEHGFEFWMDTSNLKSGDDWSEKIIKAINSCGKFLLFMSAASMSSKNVEREVHTAFKMDKKIIIIRLDDSKVPLSLDYQIGRIQWTDYLSSNWEADIVSALGGGRKYYQKPKPSPNRRSKPALPARPLPKKAPKAQPIIDGLLRIFSSNGGIHPDQCDAALSKLDKLVIVAASHWVNPSLAFEERVSRQYLLDKIEVIRSLIQNFRETCPPGSSTKRQLMLDELRLLSQELAPKTHP